MSRIKIISAVRLVFLFICPLSLYSQTAPFIFFDVRPGTDHSVIMRWRMKPETDTLAFEVERSRDKNTWERIATVNTHSSHQYSFADMLPGEGYIHYRIRQVSDKNLSIHTDAKWVQISKTRKLYIWSNPAKDVLYVKTPYNKGSLDIIDAGGRLMLKIVITDFITDVPAMRLSKGVYFLHVKNGNKILVEKFIKE